MKSPRATIAELYTECMNTYWSTLTGRPEPAKVTPKAAQVAADQEWEGEGGCCKPAKKPGTEPAPKIPL